MEPDQHWHHLTTGTTMKKIVAVLVLAGIAIAAYLNLFSEDAKLRKSVQLTLDEVVSAAQAQKPEEIRKALEKALTLDAEVVLEMRYYAPGGNTVIRSNKFLYERSGFITFVDSILTGLKSYTFAAHTTDVTKAPDGSIKAGISSASSAKGAALLPAQPDYSFTVNGTCTAEVVTEAQTQKAKRLDCVLELK